MDRLVDELLPPLLHAARRISEAIGGGRAPRTDPHPPA